MSSKILTKQYRKRSGRRTYLAVESTLQKLETRLLFDSTINVSATSCGSYGGADVSSVVIYDDANDNGVLDSGENSTSLTPVPGDNTRANGTLTIGDDSHTVHLRAQVPSNEFEWGGNNSIDFAADGTEDGSSYEFAIGPDSTISGTVFEDFNGNGTQDADDIALSGWTVYIDADGSGTLTSGDPTTTTDSSGNYSFSGGFLHKMLRISPPDSSWSIHSPGASSGNEYEITGTSMAGLNFGAQGPMTITGTVYNDSNDNGTHDTGESGVTGGSSWVVFDDLNGNGARDSGEPSANVDSSGNYTLDVSGAVTCHQLNLETPTGWRFTSPSSEFYTIPDSAHCGTTFPGYNFNVTQKGMISGTVFEDMNAQVSPLLSNPAVNGITMTLVDATTLSSVATTTTDSSGNYSFRDLTAGSGSDPYEVRAGLSSPPTGFAAETTTTASISLINGDYQIADFKLQRVLPTPANVTASETVSNGYKSITVSWDNTVNGSVSSYGFHIYQSTNGGAFTLAQTVDSTMSSYTFASLSTSNSYAYVVTTYDSNGDSAHSNVANSEAAPAPTDLIATTQLGTVTLSWTPGTGTPSGTTYSIYRFDGDNSDNPVLLTSSTSATTYTDSSRSLKHTGRRFKYKVIPHFPAISGYGAGGDGGGSGVGAIIPTTGQISYSQNVVLEAQVPVAGATTAYADSILVPHPFGLSGFLTNTTASFGFNDSALLMAPLGGSGNGRFWADGSSGHDGTGGTLDSFSLDNTASGDLPDTYSNTSPLTSGFGTSTMYFHEKVTICTATKETLQAGLGGLYIITYTYTS